MHEPEESVDLQLAAQQRKQLNATLHDLCQPLTTLHCRLELAGLIDTPEGYREAVDLGLADCARLAEVVRSMREILRAEAPQKPDGVSGEGQ